MYTQCEQENGREKKKKERTGQTKKKAKRKEFHNLIDACGYHLTSSSSVSSCVCQRKSLWDSSRFVNIRTCFLLAIHFLLDVLSVQHKCVYMYGDNCFLARKISPLIFDQDLSCSLSLSLSLSFSF